MTRRPASVAGRLAAVIAVLALALLAPAALFVGCEPRAYGLPSSARAAGERLDPPEVAGEVRLAVFGDWGTGDRGQWALVDALEDVAEDVGGFHGGLLLGDNFYPRGVRGVDDPRWDALFVRPFDTPRLGRLTWHAVLGNHDYYGDEEAQIAYGARSGGRWSMPAHFYRADFGPEGEDPYLTVLALDTYAEFSGWDAQLAWLDRELGNLAGAPWSTVVIGHHPLLSYAFHGGPTGPALDLKALIERHRPAAYLCGHDHVLQMIEKDGVGYAVLGTGIRSLFKTWTGEGSLFARSERGFGLLRASRSGLELEFRGFDGGTLFTWRRPRP